MITLFGATGYTGQKIAHVLESEGLAFRIAGRSDEKLAALSGALTSRPKWLVADASDGASLPPLFAGTSLLINCAGPFTDLGEKVIAQAAMSGTNYLDITNELGFVLRARSYREMASRTGAALAPACGFEVALADCAASIAGKNLGQKNGEVLDAVDVAYRLEGVGASAGTRRSAVRSLATSWVAYRDGSWTGQIPGGRARRARLPGGEKPVMLIPSSESVTIPLHLPTRRVDVWMTAGGGVRFWGPLLVPLLARLSRSILRGLILSIAARGGIPSETLDVGLQPDSPFEIAVEARRGRRACRVTLQGTDPYGLTARIAAYAAREMSSPGYQKKGFLPPSRVMEPRAFLQYAAEHWGLKIEETTPSASDLLII